MSVPATAVSTEAMLEAEALVGGYEATQVLHGLSLRVGAGGVTALLGGNGAGKTQVAHVQLYNFLAVPFAGIAHLDADLQRFAFFKRGFDHPGLAVFKARVAQPVAEGEQRRVRYVDVTAGPFGVGIVGAARVFFAVIHRQLAHRARKTHGQFARRVVVAQQHVAEGVARFGAQPPGFHDGAGIVGDARNGQRPAVHQHDDHGFAGFDQFEHQFFLHARQIDFCAGRGFSAHLGFFAHGDDHHVGGLRYAQGLGKAAFVVAFKIAALGVRGFKTGCAQAFEQADAVVEIAGSAPVADQFGFVVGQRADECDFLIALERERVFIIFQQHDAATRDVAGSSAVGGRQDGLFFALGVAEFVRIVEQTQVEFGLQDAANRVVDNTHRNFALLDRLRQITLKNAALQVHVHACIDRKLAGFFFIGHDAVVHHFVDRGVIGHHESFEAPFVAQDVGEEVFVAGGRHAVVVVERGHDRGGACFHGRFVGRQVVFAEKTLAHVDRIVVAAGESGAVAGVVFDAGHDGIGIAHTFALKAAHPRLGDAATQPGVFAGAFHDPAPAGIAGHIDHGCEGPVQARSGGLGTGHPRRFFNRVHIPAGGFAERDGENGFVAVNDVVAEQQGNVQAGFFHRDALQFAGKSDGVAVEQGTAGAAANVVFIPFADGGARTFPVGGVEGHLTDFFFERHLRQQFFDARVGIVLLCSSLPRLFHHKAR